MKIKLLKLVIVIVLISFLAACTTQNNTGDGGDGGDGSGQVFDIVWWGLFEKQEVIQPLIDKYKETHQNVNIQYIQITEGFEEGQQIENYRVRLDENLIDQEPLDTPDIITINHNWLGRYAQYLSPAPSSSFTADQIISDYYDVVSKDFVRGSSVYAVPLEMDSISLIVNKDLMVQLSPSDSAGPEDNWFDFKDQAERVTTYSGASNNEVNVAGFSAGLSNVQFLNEVLSLLLLQSNISMTNTDSVSGFPTEAIFANDNETQTLFEFYNKFGTEANAKTWSDKFDSEVAAFLNKKLVMYAAPSWRLNDILNLNEKYNLGLNVEVYPMPQINPGNPSQHVHWAEYWGIGVTADSQKRGQSQVAWDFIKFISQDDQLRLRNDKVNEQSDRKLDIIFPKKSLAEGQKSDEFLKTYVENLEKAKTWDMVDSFLVSEYLKQSFSTTPTALTVQSNINSNVISKRTTLLTGSEN